MIALLGVFLLCAGPAEVSADELLKPEFNTKVLGDQEIAWRNPDDPIRRHEEAVEESTGEGDFLIAGD